MSLRAPVHYGFHESTPDQNARAFTAATQAIKDCVTICRANDIPLTALGSVIDLYRDQLRAVVFGDDIKAEERRSRLISKIESARGDYGSDFVAPPRLARRAVSATVPQPDLFSMTDDELAAEAKRLGVE